MKETIKKCEICGKVNRCNSVLIESEGWKPSMFCDEFKEHLKIQQEEIYNEIPDHKKQLFLDLIHQGFTIGESYQCADLTQEEGFAVFDLNINKTISIRKKAK